MDVLQEYVNYKFYDLIGACARSEYQALLLISEGPGDETSPTSLPSCF